MLGSSRSYERNGQHQKRMSNKSFHVWTQAYVHLARINVYILYTTYVCISPFIEKLETKVI